MYGTLAGALAGRKIEFDRASYVATVEGRIAGRGKTIAIQSIALTYEITIPPDALEPTRRALAAHPQGCPAHETLKGAIAITWNARVRAGDDVVSIASETAD